ncbi:chromate transport protein [Clostridiales bacterium]|nr:chromate transport protein [Clostridiales bacterium]
MIYLELFLGFLKVGLFSFGGAYGAIPLIRDVVIYYGWLDDEMLSYIIAVSESTPGPIMVNLATYVGSSQAGFFGSLIATLAVVLPSFIIILLIMELMKFILKNPFIQTVLLGVKPCVVGIILATGVFMIIKNCLYSLDCISLNLQAAILTVILSLIYFGSKKINKISMSPIMLIILSAIAGIVAYGI